MAGLGFFCYTMDVSKNLQAYLKLKLKRAADQYAVLVDGKLVGTGRSLKPLLAKAKRRYPGKIPAVTRVPGPQTLVL
jgi:hypothetical protein